MKSWWIVFLAFAALSLVVFSCGGKPQGEAGKIPPPPSGANQAPIAPDLEAGKKVFETYCVTCHGAGGKGDGPAGKALNPPPRDLADIKGMRTLSDDQLREIIKNGKGGMPPWGATLKDEDIANVLFYLRHFSGPAS